MGNYNFYNGKGGYYYHFIKQNPEFATDEFEEYVIGRNKGDRDSGELEYIAQHEVLRLAYEFSEKYWRFNNENIRI